MMNIEKRLSDIVSDLGLERSFIKGQSVTVRNCWHFYTSGDSVESLFHSVEEFRDGMNRILAGVVWCVGVARTEYGATGKASQKYEVPVQ